MMSYSVDMNSVVTASGTLSRWADGRVTLDCWFCETWLTAPEPGGREKSGRGTITRLLDGLFAFQFMEGAKLELKIVGDRVIEPINHSPDGYKLQVRTPGHGTWMLLKPSEGFVARAHGA